MFRCTLLAGALILALALTVGQIPAAAQRGPATITVWFPLPTGGPLKEMDELVGRFNSTHTDIKANMELTGDYWQNYQKVQTAIVAGARLMRRCWS